MNVISFNLPKPVSVNGLYINSVSGRRLSKHHQRWRLNAELEIMTQRASKSVKQIHGPYRLDLVCERMGRADLGNLEKAVSDVLVEMRVVDDDKFAEEIHLSWGDVKGCRVTVRAA